MEVSLSAPVFFTFLIDYGLAVNIGCMVANSWRIGDPRLSILRRSIRRSFVAIVVGLVGHIYLFAATMLQSYQLSEVLHGMPSIMATHAGMVDAVALAAASAALILTGRRELSGRLAMGSHILLVMLILVCRSASGHAANQGNFSLSEILQFLHLAGTFIWSGVVIVCGLILRDSFLITETTPDLSFSKSLSKTCTWAVGVVLTTGIVKAYVGVEGQLTLLQSRWGGILFFKTIVVTAALVLGAIHFLQLRRPAPFASPRATRRLRTTFALEAVLLILVLAISALLATTSPPESMATLSRHHRLPVRIVRARNVSPVTRAIVSYRPHPRVPRNRE